VLPGPGGTTARLVASAPTPAERAGAPAATASRASAPARLPCRREAREGQPPIAPSTELLALSAAPTLPGFPHAGPWDRGDRASGAVGEVSTLPGGTPSRLWGWDAAPYVVTGNSGIPGGPQLRLSVYDAPDCFVPDKAGRVDGKRVLERRTVLGHEASVTSDSSGPQLSFTTRRFSVQLTGGSGVTVEDYLRAVASVPGLLEGPDLEPSQPAAAAGAPSRSAPAASRPTASARPPLTDMPTEARPTSPCSAPVDPNSPRSDAVRPPAPSAALRAVSLPDPLPGFPVRSFRDQAPQTTTYSTGGAWNKGFGVETLAASRRPDHVPGLVLDVTDAALCLDPGTPAVSHLSRDPAVGARLGYALVVGERMVAGRKALIFHQDGDPRQVGLLLATTRFTVRAYGQGVTAEDLAGAVEALQGLG